MTDMIRRLGAAARTEFGLGLGGGSFYVIGNASYLRVGYFLKRKKLTCLCDIYKKNQEKYDKQSKTLKMIGGECM